MAKDSLKIKGRFQLFEDEVLVVDKENLVTTNGSKVFAALISGDNSDVPSYLALDSSDVVYTKDSVVETEILLKEAATKTFEDNKVVYNFIIGEEEAIAQIYGFALTNNPDLGAPTNFGKVYTNLINEAFNHSAGKQIRIIWTLEVIA